MVMTDYEEFHADVREKMPYRVDVSDSGTTPASRWCHDHLGPESARHMFNELLPEARWTWFFTGPGATFYFRDHRDAVLFKVSAK
jgi:hypothetical protein